MTKILIYLLVVGMEVYGHKLSGLDKWLKYLNVEPWFKKYVGILDKYLLKHAMFNSLFGLITLFCVTAFGLGIINVVLLLFLGHLGSGLFSLVLLLALLLTHSSDPKDSNFIVFHERLFGIIFWLIFLGWFGALLYWFLIAFQRELKGLNGKYPALLSATEKGHALAAWIPSRITGLIYALAGNFSAVYKQWLGSLTNLEMDSNTILTNCGTAAMEGKPTPGEKKPAPGEKSKSKPTIGEDSLLKRAVIIWCVIGIAGALIL